MMVKSKKPKKTVNLKPEFVLDPSAPQKHRKKKKNAPDRPQPEWMFPPDEENPVLNPKAISQERQDKEKKDHDHAIKFLKYKSVTTPVKAPPPALLLTLVGAFLSSYGFNSTSRLYTTELSSRKKLEEWEVILDEKLPKGFPDLVKLFKVGQKTFEEQRKLEETSSSDSDDDDERKAYKKSRKDEKASKAAAKADETSSSGSGGDSSEEGDSDEVMEDALPVSKAATGTTRSSKKKASSSSATSSDSDADDEKEPAGAPIPTPKSSNRPTVSGLVNKLKHRTAPKAEAPANVECRGVSGAAAVEESSNEETSSEESESEDGGAEATKTNVPATAPLPESDGDSSSSTSESDSEPDFSSPTKPPTATNTTTTTTITNKHRNGSSSSETVKAGSDQKITTAETSLSSSSSSSLPNSSDLDANADAEADAAEAPVPNPTIITTQTTTKKRKHEDSDSATATKKQQKKTNTPFERVPKDTPIDARFANKYKSYDYADRAYQDLSVTKGKGFTKEKNKKKRGSYRGGAIDVGGGKGVKFED